MNKKKQYHKKNMSCYLIFLIETVVILSCYFYESQKWIKENSFELLLLITMAGLLCVSLLVCLFFRHLTIEKKVLMLIGTTALSLGILGFSSFVFSGRISFFDSLYRSIQLFVGEFDSSAFNNERIPVLLNIGRFLALFVTFGTITIILLKERIYHLTLKLFYRDILIISNRPDNYIKDLAKSFLDEKRKVIIGYTDDMIVEQDINDEIPVISINLSKDTESQLKICNVKNAKTIYLFCDNAKHNILLMKSIYRILKKKTEEQRRFPETTRASSSHDSKSVDDLIREYIRMVLPGALTSEKKFIDCKNSKKVFYIKYSTDEERAFYSLDEVFTHRTDSFSTYFINIFDISVRQMISMNSIVNNLNIERGISLPDFLKKLDEITIAIAGSGEILYRTILEMTKSCIYNSNTKLKLHYLNTGKTVSPLDIGQLPSSFNEVAVIEYDTIRDFSKKTSPVSMLFISSSNEMETRKILNEVFQYDLQNHISEIMVLTDGDIIEYNILKTFLSSLQAPYLTESYECISSPVIHLSRTKNLLLSVESFYDRYGPSGKEIHQAYQKAFINSNLNDFNSLPEVYIESNMLSSLHHQYIIDVINKVIMLKASEYSEGEINLFCDDIRPYYEYLAITEHERWFNERTLQGTIYSKQQSYVYQKNAQLLHWNQLSREKQESNIKYVISSIITKVKNDEKNECRLMHDKNIVSDYQFNNIFEEVLS